jgi:putative MFS transporter
MPNSKKMIDDDQDDEDNAKLSVAVGIDESLNQHIGFGRYQLLLLQICGSGWTYDGIEMAVIPFIQSHLTTEWSLNSYQRGLLGAIVFLGMAFGACIGGIISDRYGRKVSMVMGMLFTSLFGFSSAFCHNYYSFLLLRMGVGFGLGSTVPTDYSMVMEFVPQKRRASFVGLINMYYILGNIIESVLAWILLQNASWRWLVSISSSAGFLSFIARWFIYESPRYLLVNRREEEALDVLRSVATINQVKREYCILFDEGVVLKKIQTTVDDDETDHLFKQLRMITSPKLLHTSILLWIIWFLLSYGGWGFMFLIPILFNDPHSSTNSFVFPIITYAVALVGYLLCCFIIDWYSRRKFATMAFISSGICTIMMGVMSVSPFLILVQSMIVNFISTWAWSVMNLYTPEIYPTKMRSTGLGVCNAFTRLGGVITPLIGQVLLERFGVFLPYATFGLALIIAGVCVSYVEYDIQPGTALQDDLNNEQTNVLLQSSTLATTAAAQGEEEEEEIHHEMPESLSL